MKSVIRWKGFIAFVVITGAVAAFFLLLADTLAKHAIESAGTRIVGAKVEVADVDLSFFPSAITIADMQITNPDAPMKNAAEIARLGFSFNLLDLLEKKLIINKMAVDGVRFNTDRATSGAIKKQKKQAAGRQPDTVEKPAGFTLPSLDAKDIKSILEKEKQDLAVVKEIDQLQVDIKTKEKEFRQRLETLPDEDKFKAYESRLKKLEGTKSDVFSILGGLSDASGVYKDIKADLANIQAAKKDVTATAQDFKNRIRQLPQLAKKDANRLKNKYALTPEGMGNLTEQLFGPKYAKWIKTGLQWYEKLQPLLAKAQTTPGAEKDAVPPQPERGKGINVPFPERSPRPDLLIRQAAVSATTTEGDIAGTIKNICSNQVLLGQPLTFDFAAEKMKQLDALSVTGALDRTRPEAAKDILAAKLKNIRLTDITISESANFPLTLSSGQADLRFDGVIKDGALRAESAIVLTAAKFAGKDTRDMGRLETSMMRALSEVPKISLNADINGSLKDYAMAVSSNIDKVLKQAVADVARQETKAFTAKLQDQINAQMQDKLNSANLEVGDLNAISRELTQRLNLGNRLLKM